MPRLHLNCIGECIDCNFMCGSEENVYMLCKKLSELGLAAPDASDLFVVFISNPIRQVKTCSTLCVQHHMYLCAIMIAGFFLKLRTEIRSM